MKKKKAKLERPLSRRNPVKTPSSLAFPLLRTFLLAAVGVVAAAYGIYRFYTVVRPPMLVPVAPPPAPSEIPIEVE